MGKIRRASDASSSMQGSPRKKVGRIDIPDVSALGSLSKGGSAQAIAPSNDDINVCIMKYCTDGSVYSEVFSSSNLYVMQMVCTASPNPIFMLKKQVEMFGAKHQKEDESRAIPKNLDDMGAMYRAVHTYVGQNTNDIDNVGWKKKPQWILYIR